MSIYQGDRSSSRGDVLVAVSVPVSTNKPIDKNATGQHCGTDHDAEDGHPNDSRDVHRGHVTAQRRQPPNFAIVT